jgi:hypothetical protein
VNFGGLCVTSMLDIQQQQIRYKLMLLRFPPGIISTQNKENPTVLIFVNAYTQYTTTTKYIVILLKPSPLEPAHPKRYALIRSLVAAVILQKNSETQPQYNPKNAGLIITTTLLSSTPLVSSEYCSAILFGNCGSSFVRVDVSSVICKLSKIYFHSSSSSSM